MDSLDLDEVFRDIVKCYKTWDLNPKSHEGTYFQSKIYSTYNKIIFSIYYNLYKKNRKSATQKLKDFLLEITEINPVLFNSLLIDLKQMTNDQKDLVEIFYLNSKILCDTDILNVFIKATIQTLESRNQDLINQFLQTNCLINFNEEDLQKIFFPLELEDYIYIISAFGEFYNEKNENYFKLYYDVFEYFFRIIFRTINQQESKKQEYLAISIKQFINDKYPEFYKHIKS